MKGCLKQSYTVCCGLCYGSGIGYCNVSFFWSDLSASSLQDLCDVFHKAAFLTHICLFSQGKCIWARYQNMHPAVYFHQRSWGDVGVTHRVTQVTKFWVVEPCERQHCSPPQIFIDSLLRDYLGKSSFQSLFFHLLHLLCYFVCQRFGSVCTPEHKSLCCDESAVCFLTACGKAHNWWLIGQPDRQLIIATDWIFKNQRGNLSPISRRVQN